MEFRQRGNSLYLAISNFLSFRVEKPNLTFKNMKSKPYCALWKKRVVADFKLLVFEAVSGKRRMWMVRATNMT